jgi:dynactin 1
MSKKPTPTSGIPSRLPAPSVKRQPVQATTGGVEPKKESSIPSAIPKVPVLTPPVTTTTPTSITNKSEPDLSAEPSVQTLDQLKKEKDALNYQNKDLSEKLETLKLKRAEDREKIREFEKSKIQLQQVI